MYHALFIKIRNTVLLLAASTLLKVKVKVNDLDLKVAHMRPLLVTLYNYALSK